MTTRIHERIRQIIETTPGLTQRGLAEHMGLNPAAVNRMLYGRRNIMVEEIPVIEDYLGVKLDIRDARNVEYRQDVQAGGRRGFSDRGAAPLLAENAASLWRSDEVARAPLALPPVPVFKDLRGGEIVDWVARHPLQAGIRDAYALYVASDEMEPRYFRGEIVYLHPGRPAEPMRDCVIETVTGEVHLRQLVARDEEKVSVQQYNPARRQDFAAKELRAVYSVIGRG